MPILSFFNAPIQNITPNGVMSLRDCYEYIISDRAKSQTEQLRSIENKQEHRAYKSGNFDFVTPSGEFSTRSSKGLLSHSGIICLDFDHIGERLGNVKQQIAADANFPSMLVFTSPSGDGLKVFLQPNVNENNHTDVFTALTTYFEYNYGLIPDQSGKDVSRACFLCHDPEAIFHESVIPSPFRPDAYRPEPARTIYAPMPMGNAFASTNDKIEFVIQEARVRRIDLTSKYEDWLHIGFALANELGEGGRSYYHKLSQLYPRYTVQETEKQFNNCLRSSNGRITIGTLFHLAKEAGIEVPSVEKTAAHSAHSAHIDIDFDSDPELRKLPTITDTIEDRLPEILKRCLSGAKNTLEKDVRLLSSLAVISAGLPSVYGVYAGYKVYPHVFIVFDGPGSSRKGCAAPASRIARPIHDRFLREYDEAKKEFTSLHNDWMHSDKTEQEPVPPRQKAFFIPANITQSAFIAQLADNGGEGIIMEMEIDTLSNSFRSQHGNYSSVLRKVAHHEDVSMRRRGNDEYIEIRNPRVALCITGTPDQINRFIGNAENGFFSRIQFYCTSFDLGWLSPWTATEEQIINSQFDDIGRLFYKQYYCRLVEHDDFVFTLNAHQQQVFDMEFASAKLHLFEEEGVNMLPSVHRMGLFCFRVAMILGILKTIGDDIPITDKVICDDDSFEVAMSISMKLLEHVRFVYRHLPSSSSGANPQAEKLLKELPSSFGRKDYAAVAKRLGINNRTADRYVSQFVSSQVIRKAGQNKYIK